MKLPQKIKSYFARYGFHSWKEMDWNEKQSAFTYPEEENLLEIGSLLRQLDNAETPDNPKLRMNRKSARIFDSLDDLIPWLRAVILEDLKETSLESDEHGWDFRYFTQKHNSCQDTICICNGLNSKIETGQNCIYAMASIRKFEGKYYGWSNVFPA
ncbi:hypothetical protein [Flavobacterium silvaticum]|uniref:Uncharacterized protein n=1 Tax=Flavobacterium silvaticum TaxID=1852020 RepID=A0A972FJC3_9FLAO|nr:hypothetical protein [Flavobacterium silvaticum]NMH27114.1 hypothetical protein [Flavobacterium silvaticum]